MVKFYKKVAWSKPIYIYIYDNSIVIIDVIILFDFFFFFDKIVWLLLVWANELQACVNIFTLVAKHTCETYCPRDVERIHDRRIFYKLR